MRTRNWQITALWGIGVLSAIGLGGCGLPAGYQTGGPVPTAAPLHQIKTGAGTVVQPGTQAGYGITANVGSSLRAVWTGDAAASGTYRQFQGSIYTPGHFTSVTPGCAGNACALESGDYISLPMATPGGMRIDFDTTATTGLDGLDFVVDQEPVYFDLLIDGLPYPQLVFFTDAATRQTASAAAIPFGLTTH